MNFVLDTSAFSRFTDSSIKTTDLDAYFNSENTIYIPLIVVAELRAGYKCGSRYSENESALQRFLDSPNVTILYPTDTTASMYANIYSELRRLGKPIGVNDMWIAALCFEHNLPLLTTDKDFARIPDLPLT